MQKDSYDKDYRDWLQKINQDMKKMSQEEVLDMLENIPAPKIEEINDLMNKNFKECYV